MLSLYSVDGFYDRDGLTLRSRTRIDCKGKIALYIGEDNSATLALVGGKLLYFNAWMTYLKPIEHYGKSLGSY